MGVFGPTWQLIEAGWATLAEIETHYSLDDVLKASGVLEYRDEQRRKAEESKSKG